MQTRVRKFIAQRSFQRASLLNLGLRLVRKIEAEKNEGDRSDDQEHDAQRRDSVGPHLGLRWKERSRRAEYNGTPASPC